MKDNRYMLRGVSAAKEDVHNAIKNIDKGLYPQAFCKIIPDILGGDPEYSGFLLDHFADDVVRDAFLVSRFRLENGDALAVVHVKSVPGAEPH